MTRDLIERFDKLDSEMWGAGQQHYEGVHGLSIPEHQTCFLLVHGSEVRGGEIMPAPANMDIVPTVLYHMLRQDVCAEEGLEGRVLRCVSGREE